MIASLLCSLLLSAPQGLELTGVVTRGGGRPLAKADIFIATARALEALTGEHAAK